MGSVEKDQHGHDFSVRNTTFSVATTLSRGVNEVFFQFWLKKFTEFVEYTINFHYICSVHRSDDFICCICNYLVFTYKDTNNFSLLQLFEELSYTELTLV